jgi:hypothetical protein
MQWIAPSEKDSANDTLEKRLREAADQLRANSGLNPQQYSGPVLGLIFLCFAEVRFAKRRAELQRLENQTLEAMNCLKAKMVAELDSLLPSILDKAFRGES